MRSPRSRSARASPASASPLPANGKARVYAIVVAAVLDGMDGRIARMLHGAEPVRRGARFAVRRDRLRRVAGDHPSLWSLQAWPRIGWLFALAYAVCMALRLARFNAQIDVEDQPHKSAGFLTGVPAPAGAGLLLLPICSGWRATGNGPGCATIAWSRPGRRCSPSWLISSVATFSWARSGCGETSGWRRSSRRPGRRRACSRRPGRR